MAFFEQLFNLTGKITAITGSAGFLCSEMALGFHRAGCSVVLMDSDIVVAKTVAEKIKDDGGKALALKMDVSCKQDFEHCLEKILDEFGKVEVLINGAGINAPTPFLDISEDEWDRILAVHLKGTMFGCQVF
ncbi:uncharacterized protein METZ01_LOCUS469477, partial [marine metagenome]